MAETFTPWDPVQALRTEEDMTLYLAACREEDPGDGCVVRAAMNDINQAREAEVNLGTLAYMQSESSAP